MNPCEIEKLAELLAPIVVNNHWGKTTLLNKTDFIFSLSRERKRKLFLSLENSQPFLTLAEIPSSYPTLSSPFHTLLKRELDDGLIQSIEARKNDRILVIQIERISDTYETLRRHLILELIANHPNAIVTDGDWSILGVFKPSASLEEKRPLLRGLRYQFPTPMPERSYPTPEIHLQALYDRHELEALQSRGKEKYKTMFSFVKGRIDSLKKKLVKLEMDRQRGFDKMIDKDKGNALLASIGSVPEGTASLSVDGLEIVLNPQWSLSDNANAYFKSYRKSKNAQIKAKEQQALASEELSYLEAIYATMQNLPDEDMEEIAIELKGEGFSLASNSPKKPPKIKAIFPYFITVEGIKIGFGRNNLQNDHLTFKLAKSNHVFCHIKNDHGAHVVIFDEHPNDAVKTAAAEVALWLSGKPDGEVMMTPKSKVKKGIRPGLVILDHYQSFVLKNIRPETIAKIKEARR